MNALTSSTVSSLHPIVEWCEEFDCYVARCPGLFPGVLHGMDPDQLLKDLVDAMCEWLQSAVAAA